MRRNLVISLVLLLFLFSVQPIFAHHRERVLGVSTSLSDVTFSHGTAEGPGRILPDSPFYFLDNWFQNVKLLLAFSPSQKAQVRMQIVGERLAEMRLMLTKNNLSATNFALTDLLSNVQLSASDLQEASVRGEDVAKIAQKLNEEIKTKKAIIKSLSEQSTGELKLRLALANNAMKEAKNKIEDELPQDQLQKEILEDLQEQAQERANEVAETATKLKHDLEELNKEASEAAQKSLKNREEVLKKAIEKRNEALQKVSEKLLENEKKKQKQMLEVQTKASVRAQEAITKAEEAAKGLQTASQTIQQIQTQSSNSPKIENPEKERE